MIEEQRGIDHGHFLQMSTHINTMIDYIRNTDDSNAAHVQSVDQRFTEILNTGMSLRQDYVVANNAIQQQSAANEDRINTWAAEVNKIKPELEASNHREAIVQAHIEQRSAERPVEGMIIKDQVKEVRADIEDMKVTLNAFSRDTVAAVQGAAAPMPKS